IVAALQYPTQFNPVNNWISDMGNYDKNPAGAIIFNACAFVAGLLLVPFFAGLASWYYVQRKDKYYYVAAELFGFVGALGLVMIGIFQQGTSLHSLWAMVCFGSLVIVFIVAGRALLRNPEFNRLIGYYGYVAALIGLIFFVLFVGMTDTPIFMEWLTVYGAFLWILLVSFNALSPNKAVR
ncbi:MAG: DUF998 domain-containing protein, partial [Methanocella sp.]